MMLVRRSLVPLGVVALLGLACSRKETVTIGQDSTYHDDILASASEATATYAHAVMYEGLEQLNRAPPFMDAPAELEPDDHAPVVTTTGLSTDGDVLELDEDLEHPRKGAGAQPPTDPAAKAKAPYDTPPRSAPEAASKKEEERIPAPARPAAPAETQPLH